MQARALRRRCAVNGSMTVLGDLAQATGPHTHTGWDRLGTLLSDHGDWRVAELNTSYRVPAEIMAFVAPLARTVAPGLPYPQAVREAGEGAVRTLATEPGTLLGDTVAQVTRLVGTSDGRALRSVAVIVPDGSRWLDEISRGIEQSRGITDRSREAVSVLAASQAKGMEYDHVLVVEPTAIADQGPAGLRRLYIALTRSTQSLTVLHTAPLPEILTAGHGRTEPAAPETPPGTPTPQDAAPEIGTDIRVRVLGPGPGGRYKVKALSLDLDRPLVLTVRHGSTPPRPGQELDCWVFANETNQSVLTADQRGRLPISPRMAERYASALTVLDDLLSDTGDPQRPTLQDARNRLSELQGMANRVLRRDQADWVDVRRLLGSPDRHRLVVLRDLAAGANRALKDNTLDLPRLQSELTASGWPRALTEAQQTLRSRPQSEAPEALRPDPLPEPEETLRFRPAAQPEPDSEHTPATPAPHRPRSRPEQKETEPVTSVETAPAAPAVTTKEGFLLALETSATADRLCKKHEAVRYALKSALLWADIQPADSPVVDVSCLTDHGLSLYEVLGAGRSTYDDLRSGATRLLEINHTLPTPASALYLVLCEPPAEDWSADTVRDVFNVHVLWRTPDGWGGQAQNTALPTLGT